MGLGLLPWVAVAVMQTGLEPGATLRLYDVGMEMAEMPELVAGQTPNIDRKVDRLEFGQGQFGLADRFFARVQFVLEEPRSRKVWFKLTSDDGSQLRVNGKLAIENGGVHAAQSKTAQVDLRSGRNKIVIDFFENSGDESLKLEWSQDGSNYVVLDSSAMWTESGVTRVVSPGRKAVKGIGGPRRPGNGMPLEAMHPSWEVINIRPKDFKPQVGALAALSNGSLLVGTFSPNQSGVFLPEKRDGNLYRIDFAKDGFSSPRITEVAAQLQEPLGLHVRNVNGRDRVYLTERTQVSELIDADGDGNYEQQKTVATGWKADNYHHFTFGLAEGDGSIYIALATSITGGAAGANGPNPEYRGCTIRINPDHFDPNFPRANWEVISGGHRTPNGISSGPFGLVLVGENQGSWQPSNKINVVEVGKFFGHYNNVDFKTKEYPNGGHPGPFDNQPLSAPAIYIPQNECGNSPSGMATLGTGIFKNQVLVADVKYGGLKRAWLEKSNGVWQGGIVQYAHGLECGTNRLAWLPNGMLAVGGIGATETWAWTDPKSGQWTTFGLQLLKPTLKSAFEIHSVRVVESGLEVRFTEPLSSRPDVDKLHLSQWRYEPTVEYGGPKIDREKLQARSIVPLDSSRKAWRINIPGMKSGRVLHGNLDVRNAQGRELWASEFWQTVNVIPAKQVQPSGAKPFRALIFSKTAGYRHDCIEEASAAITKELKAVGGSVVTSENSAVFTPENLKTFDVVIFLCTTGDILNQEQEAAFESYMRDGGGFVGLHAAADTEYQWSFFGECVGAYFKSHPAIQQARVIPTKAKHPSTAFLPSYWDRVDEWYDYRSRPSAKTTILATVDESTYKGGTMGKDHPIAWCADIGKGRSWYTGGGHTKGSYRETLFMKHVVEGVLWAGRISR